MVAEGGGVMGSVNFVSREVEHVVLVDRPDQVLRVPSNRGSVR